MTTQLKLVKEFFAAQNRQVDFFLHKNSIPVRENVTAIAKSNPCHKGWRQNQQLIVSVDSLPTMEDFWQEARVTKVSNETKVLSAFVSHQEVKGTISFRGREFKFFRACEWEESKEIVLGGTVPRTVSIF